MVKAIIFDCFGVLTSDGWLPYKTKHFGSDPELLEQAGQLNKRADGGLISYHEFVTEVAALAGVSVAQARSEIESNVTDEAVFELIASRLKPKYKIGLLSNAGANWLPELFAAEQVALFDAVGLSFQTGFVKPDPRAYAALARELGLEIYECLFVDDQEIYVEGAKLAGMPAVQFKGADELIQHIEALEA